ncbi:hypothetical protein K439DRAFT_1639544 [Ramaria rubella]|nr:hypothetical protein K439DRAFT_1639544 [Ramaria rubella]
MATTQPRERPRVSIAKTPNARAVTLDALAQEYGADIFTETLHIKLPVATSFDIWWRLKFCNVNLCLPSAKQSEDAIHAEPSRTT